MRSVLWILGVVAATWFVVNMLTFSQIVAGEHGDYLPYVNAPIKWFVWLVS